MRAGCKLFLNRLCIAVAELNLGAFCLGIEVEAYDHVASGKLSIQIVGKGIELRVGLLVGIFACIEIDNVAAEEVRRCFLSERLEPDGRVRIRFVEQVA